MSLEEAEILRGVEGALDGTEYREEAPEIEFNVKLNFVDERSVPFDQISKPGDPASTSSERQDDDLLGLPTELTMLLRQLEPRVLASLNASDANRLAFFEDPVKFLSDIGCKIERSQQKNLIRARGARLLGDGLPGQIKLHTISLMMNQQPGLFGPRGPQPDPVPFLDPQPDYLAAVRRGIEGTLVDP